MARSFYCYHNSCDEVPWKYNSIPAGKTRVVEVPTGFEGRITRGNNKLNVAGVPRLLAAVMRSTGAHLQRRTGFYQWVLDGARRRLTRERWTVRRSSTPLRASMPPFGPSHATGTDLKKVGAKHAYVDDVGHGSLVINSSSGRFGI
ncbi:hypothetical protein F5B22DRAFT_649250 [Xylaria bambusicola]|uniref:uncharacterized protein n=1 Tax=Xylaria bambusicola TaxID=326684 RepID=UPI0020077184|nr:uncharacterized protein F5B22DRAFT_649250 [Xylaria bambusicola]KAI0509202.1 hypothetical protein F5B22DRAFT_649250 [Xylaria bambusicola]